MEDPGEVSDGDHCLVIGGSHAGKAGLVENSKLSPAGHRTITVRQASGERFKTLARNVRRSG